MALKREYNLPIATSLDSDDYIRVLKLVGSVLKSERISHDDFVTWLNTVISAGNTQGYTLEAAGQLIYVGAQAYSVTPNSMDVNGTILTWAANIARTGISLTANTLYYVYLYDSGSGVAAVEESTTVPVWDNALNYYKKTGDATRRCIGFIEASATNVMRKFHNTVIGRTSEIIYNDGVSNPDKVVVNLGTSSTAWASFTLAPLIPVHATHVHLIPKLNFNAINDEGIVGISAIDLGAAIANTAPFQVRDKMAAASTIFFGQAWIALVESQTLYYRTFNATGTVKAFIEAWGARFIR